MSRRVPLAFAPFLLLAACVDRLPTDPVADVSPAGPTAAAEATAATVSTVMSGLNSPKGLEFGPDGALYVTESGTTAVQGACAPVARGENCYSGTGAISRLRNGQQERVVTGLPSVYNAAAGDVAGPQDIALQSNGDAYVTIGWGASPDTRAGLGNLGPLFGSLVRVSPSGQWQVVADVAGFEAANNPAGGPLDSNPFGLLAEVGRRFVADAGGNSLLDVDADGRVGLSGDVPSTTVPAGPFNPPFAEFEAVPTEVTRGPDGALYVGGLTGVPFLPGAASIYRVVPGQPPQVYARGFTANTDHAWAADGALYVLQYASAPFLGGPGSVIRVAPDGSRSTVIATLANPTGITVGSDGAVYVSNKGNLAGVGEVLRIAGTNASPTVAGLRADPASGPYSVSAKSCGGRYTACVRFRVSDVDGTGDGPFAVTVDWGDGTMWTPNRVPAETPLLAPHDYQAAGTYAVTIIVADLRGVTGTAKLSLVVTP